MRMFLLGVLMFSLSGCVEQPVSVFDQQADTQPSLEIHPSTARPVPEVPFKLQLQGKWPANFTAIEPAYPNHITSMVVRDYHHAITSSAGWTRLNVDLEVEAVQAGVHYVPPFTIVLYAEGASETVLRTYPLYLDARLQAAESVEDIRDIKPLWRAPIRLPVTVVIAGVLAFVLLGVVFLVWHRRQHKHEANAADRLQQVLAQLQAHTDKHLDRDQASELSLALRAWYENGSGLAVAEMTPREIRACAKAHPMHKPWLVPLAALCDRLAFVQFGTAETSQEPVSIWLQAVSDLPEIPAAGDPEGTP